MTEPMKIVYLNLPVGQDYALYADLGIVGLSRRLDAVGRERALDAMQAEWRASLTPLPEAGAAESSAA